MKISIEWLREFVEVDASTDELIDVFPMLGMEVEGVEGGGPPPLDKVVVGEVLSREQHPEADRLTVCKVKVGEDLPDANIVCGATNFQPGDRVLVALPGAKLPGGFKIKKSKLRGVTSEGMMCSSKELNLGDDHDGLLILTDRPEIGVPISEVFADSDVTFGLELTANRGDCLGHVGVARELAARYGKELQLPEVKSDAPTLSQPSADNFLQKISIVSANCKLYCAWSIRGVTIGPSPDWLRRRLESVGLRSINNVVDATNYVLMETGQPLHAFDAKKIGGSEIVVRDANPGETITTLDEVERKLDESMMVIADAEKPLVVAGVMGSQDAEVDDATTDLVLEAAWFVPGNVRATSRKLGLSTDSSIRFARDVDPQFTRFAARRAIDLILETAGGELIPEEIQVGESPRGDRSIEATPSFVRETCGYEVDDEQIADAWRRLGFTVEPGETWKVTVPSFRSEVDRPIDLVEEFVRIHGTTEIPAGSVVSESVSRDDSQIFSFGEEAADSLVGQGFRECCHYSLRDGKEIEAWHGKKVADALALANPLTAEHTHARASMLPGLLDALAHNQRNQNDLRRVFEAGRVLRPTPKGVVEVMSVAFAILTKPIAREWKPESPPDFHEAKLCAHRLLEAVGIAMPKGGLRPLTGSPAWQDGHAASAGDVTINRVELTVGYCHLALSREKEVNGPVLCGELLVDPVVLAKKAKPVKFQRFGSFPPALKDLALVVTAETSAEDVRFAVQQAAEKATDNQFAVDPVRLFDVFEGEGLGEGKKSVACAIRFRSDERTLEDKEVNAAFEKIQSILSETTDYALRT
ncbi:MAG: phenylalanine--tRNA ligase subunit beta [Opitutales bacterium]|nr:phenylalanine--tRNA ligase subunit beta [Opitutales bacterium]